MSVGDSIMLEIKEISRQCGVSIPPAAVSSVAYGTKYDFASAEFPPFDGATRGKITVHWRPCSAPVIGLSTQEWTLAECAKACLRMAQIRTITGHVQNYIEDLDGFGGS